MHDPRRKKIQQSTSTTKQEQKRPKQERAPTPSHLDMFAEKVASAVSGPLANSKEDNTQ